jgi:hypothetical protein
VREDVAGFNCGKITGFCEHCIDNSGLTKAVNLLIS